MYRLLLLAFLTMITSLHAEEEAPFSLVNQTAQPISKVFGDVHVVTGDLVFNERLEVVSGPDPYVLGANYTSSNLANGTLADGWDLFHPLELQVYQRDGIEYMAKGGGNPCLLHYREAGGAIIRFEGSRKARHFEPILKNTGYTNGTGREAGQAAIQNIEIEKHEKGEVFEIRLGDGTRRYYECTTTPKRRPAESSKVYYLREYRIYEERLPTGRWRFYKYDKEGELSSIKTYCGDKKTVVHEVYFHEDKHHAVVVETSDGRTFKFPTEKIANGKSGKKRVVRALQAPGRMSLALAYHEGVNSRLTELERKDGFKKVARYYKKGSNEVLGKTRKPKSEAEAKFWKGRVREVHMRTRRGAPLTEIGLCYHQKQRSTEVLHPDGVQQFFWNKEQRIERVEWRDKKGTIVQKITYRWGDVLDEGNLRTMVVYDDRDRATFSKSFAYDKRGNVIRERINGFWSRKFAPPLTLEKGVPTSHKCDHYTIYRTYTDDGLNLVKKEWDSYGSFTRYHYQKGTNLITALFSGREGIIKKRQFFHYNKQGLIEREILDDSSSSVEQELKNFSYRKIIKREFRTEVPHFGVVTKEATFVLNNGLEQHQGTIRYHRNSRGLLVEKCEKDAQGKKVASTKYSYDKQDRLIASITNDGAITKCSYDEVGRIASQEGPLPNHKLFFRYDFCNNVVEQREIWPDKREFVVTNSYDHFGRKIATVDNRGRKTEFKYDAVGRLLQITHPAVEAGTPITRYSYHGRRTMITSPTGEVTTQKSTPFGKPLWQQNPDGTIDTWAYDGKGRLLSETKAGVTTEYSYDEFDRAVVTRRIHNGKVLQTSSRRYSAFNLIEEVTPTGLTTCYRYDPFGRKVEETTFGDGITNKTLFEYDSASRLQRVLHPNGTTTTYAYDSMSRVVEEKVEGTTLLSLSQKQYDQKGRAIESRIVTEKGVAVTKSCYLPDDSIISVTDPLGNSTTITSTYKAISTKTTQLPNGVVIEECFDARDLPIQTRRLDPQGKEVMKEQRFYDLSGRITRSVEQVIGGTTPSEVTTRFSYNKRGNLETLIKAAGTPEEARIAYSYNALGQKCTEVKPSGLSLHYAYDIEGRLSRLTSSDNALSQEFTYDTYGRCIKATDGSTVERRYNKWNSIEQELLDGLAITRGYDALGQLERITLPDGSYTTYSYHDGLLKELARHAAGGEIRYFSSYLSRSCGRPKEVQLPLQAGVVTYDYDLLGRCVTTAHPSFTEERTLFDSVGNLRSRTLHYQEESLSQEFGYDYLDQLSSSPEGSYTFDSLNRRVKYNDRSWSYNAQHQLLSDGLTTLRYDTDGRRVEEGTTYDALDRLTHVELENSHVDFGYDAFHRRLWKKVSDHTGEILSYERFLYIDDNEIGSVDAATQLTSFRFLGEGLGAEIGASLAFEVNDRVMIPLHDLMGNVTCSLDATGLPLEMHRYTPFGITTSTVDKPLSPWLFSSKRVDPETGYSFFGRRYYDATHGQFVTQDPLGLQQGPNLYAYVRNHPLTALDLYGLAELKANHPLMQDRARDILRGDYGITIHNPMGKLRISPEKMEEALRQSEAAAAAEPNQSAGADLSTLRPGMHNLDGTRTTAEHFKAMVEKYGVIGFYFNGMLNTAEEVFETGEYILKCHQAGGGILLNRENFFMIITPTEGFAKDLCKSIMNTSGIPTEDVRMITEHFRGLNEAAKGAELQTGYKIIAFSHSRGAVISELMFRGLGGFGNFNLYSFTFGGAVSHHGCKGCNYITRLDLVPFLSPVNQVRLATGIASKIFVGQWQNPGSAHEMRGAGYRQALNHAFEYLKHVQ